MDSSPERLSGRVPAPIQQGRIGNVIVSTLPGQQLQKQPSQVALS